jgi:hypothetical protein
MKSIHNLVKDIYGVVGSTEGLFTPALAEEFSRELGLRLVERVGQQDKVPTLRLSQMGDRCPCALWHSIHTPLAAEPLPPWARIKFLYGDILETFVITMAKAAGHEVTGEQDEVVVDGITGHRDCVIDGCIVDVKSASSRSFQKFKDKSIKTDDPFGYLAQLDGYIVGSADDDLVQVKDKGYLLAIDKTLGHLCIYEHTLREDHIRKRVATYKDIVALDRAPACTCETVPDGKSGNVKLGIRASYNPFKYCCWPQLRTFLYASGPVYLTKVVRKPDVTEIDRYGKIVYN